jgi:hypothetical protein
VRLGAGWPYSPTSRTAGDAIATGIKPIYIAVNSAAAAELRDNLDAKWAAGICGNSVVAQHLE